MGWASGSDIANAVVDQLNEADPALFPDHVKIVVYTALIRAMFEHDWDTEDEVDDRVFQHAVQLVNNE